MVHFICKVRKKLMEILKEIKEKTALILYLPFSNHRYPYVAESLLNCFGDFS